jgi:hypothetical protein
MVAPRIYDLQPASSHFGRVSQKKFPGALHVLGMAPGAGCGRHFADAAPLSQAIPPSLGPCAMEKAHPSCNRR